MRQAANKSMIFSTVPWSNLDMSHPINSVSVSSGVIVLRCCTNELGWQARTAIEVIKWKGAWPEEAIQVKFCGQDVIRRSQGALCE